ncbi:hypothetical protein MKW98_002288 [Papaver atlanticum]|uniref:Uncharacterized protein n=1 Tax=Papaver atlanticum TaxID=357466 RepID=A0AAD4X3Q6_9MAGN|nr:hypothetical protein MKW98_002288 [Papaver atlanticum]
MTGGQMGNQDPRPPNITNFLTYILLSNYGENMISRGAHTGSLILVDLFPLSISTRLWIWRSASPGFLRNEVFGGECKVGEMHTKIKKGTKILVVNA